MTLGWVNDYRIVMFGWTIPLKQQITAMRYWFIILTILSFVSEAHLKPEWSENEVCSSVLMLVYKHVDILVAMSHEPRMMKSDSIILFSSLSLSNVLFLLLFFSLCLSISAFSAFIHPKIHFHSLSFTWVFNYISAVSLWKTFFPLLRTHTYTHLSSVFLQVMGLVCGPSLSK